MKKRIFGLLLIMIISSCIDEREYNLNYSGDKLIVFAHGTLGKGLWASVSRTIEPLTQKDIPSELHINNAEVYLIENEKIVDSLLYIGGGLYQTTDSFKFKTESTYKLKVTCEGYSDNISENVTMPKPSILKSIDIAYIGQDTVQIARTYVFEADVSVLDEGFSKFNSFDFKYLVDGSFENEGVSFEFASNYNLNCLSCFNFLNNKCLEKKGSIYYLKPYLRIENSDIGLYERIDSIRFFLHTFSESADLACKNEFDIDEYIEFTLPIKPSVAPTYTNFSGGYGVFTLESVDSITIKE